MLRYDLRYTLRIVREQLLVIVFFFYIYSDMTVLVFPAQPGVQLKMKKTLVSSQTSAAAAAAVI